MTRALLGSVATTVDWALVAVRMATAEDVAGLHAQDRDRSPLGNQSPQGKTAGDQDPHFGGFFAFPENDLVRLEVRMVPSLARRC